MAASRPGIDGPCDAQGPWTLPVDETRCKRCRVTTKTLARRAVQADNATLDMVVPRQERSVESTQRLIEAATELFLERGYAAATVAAIGDWAGFSRGIVAARFGSKENLAWAVVEKATRHWNDAVGEHNPAGTGLDAVVGFIRISQDNMVNDPTSRLVLERLFSESAGPMAPLHDRFANGLRDFQALVARFIQRGIDDGSVRADTDPYEYAGVLIAQLRGVGYQWFLFPGHVDPVLFHELIIDQVVGWLTPRHRTPTDRPDQQRPTTTQRQDPS